MRDEASRPRFKQNQEKVVRFDAAPAIEQVPEPCSGGLLELFRAWVKKQPQERRCMPRHPTVADRVWLGWWKGNAAFFANPARLLNLSRGGALVHGTDPPPEGFTAWLCLGETEPEKYIEATVLEVRSTRRRECVIRLSFREPCPHDFFDAAVCMLGPAGARNGAAARTADGSS